MSMIQFLSKRKITRRVVMSIVFGLGFLTLASNIYIRFHYASVMPRSPQPQSGRTYGIPAQYGGVVYVSKQELDRRDFVENDLVTVFGVGMILLVIVEAGLGWFEKRGDSGSMSERA
jgi:hypothetical protein